MKNKFIILLIIVILLTTGIVYSKKSSNYNFKGKVIVIDVGHGGKDVGASVNNILEKDLNLKISLKLREILINCGASVFMTRDGDFDLSNPNANRRKKSDFDNRIKLINSSKADLYLSIHMNYLGDSKYYGAQVFYTGNNKELATIMQDSFIKKLKSPMKAKKLSNDIYMFKQLKIPGILIECGFLSNKNERYLLVTDKYQDRIVQTILDGLINYFNIQSRPF